MTDGAESGGAGERAPDDLPWVDEHASEIDAPASVVWPALLRTVERMTAGGAAPRYARAVGCADTEAGGPRPLEVGSTVPGFHVAELAPRALAQPRRLAPLLRTTRSSSGSNRWAVDGPGSSPRPAPSSRASRAAPTGRR